MFTDLETELKGSQSFEAWNGRPPSLASGVALPSIDPELLVKLLHSILNIPLCFNCYLCSWVALQPWKILLLWVST